MLKKTSAVLLGLALSVALNAGSAMAGDAAAGEKYYKKKCKACHGKLVEGGKHSSGPNLWGVTTRLAGKAEGFSKYSAGLAAADFIWSDENLDKWLTKPKDFIPKAKMAVKVKKEKDRAKAIDVYRVAERCSTDNLRSRSFRRRITGAQEAILTTLFFIVVTA